MSFFDEIANIVSFSSVGKADYNIFLRNGTSIYIDGINRIVSITHDYIELLTKKDLLELIGVNLIIRQVTIDSVVIDGIITTINITSR